MENLPVEVIGNILSQLGAARDVVIASATCKKWYEAHKNHLNTLSFDYNDWSSYHDLSSTKLQILITQTVLQTNRLQCLTIIMSNVANFSAAPVIAWLMYTKETLRVLSYHVRTSPNFNILEKCNTQKIEVLALSHNSIVGVEHADQKFLALRTLSLNCVRISALDLGMLLMACPKIVSLSLISPNIGISDPHSTLELCSSSLEDAYIEGISLDKFALEADSLKKLHLKDCALDFLELIGKGSLNNLRIDDVSVIHLDIGDCVENLEVVDVSNFTIMWPKFYPMISRSSKLTRLRLWGVVFDDEDEVVDVETISSCFPRLKYLSLSYDLRDEVLNYSLQGSSYLESVIVLELGWILLSDLFSHWVEGLLERCPSLRKLVICGVVSEAKTREDCLILANFTSCIVRLMRLYMDVEVQFKYE